LEQFIVGTNIIFLIDNIQSEINYQNKY